MVIVSYLLPVLMFLTALFLILLILIQRGRGGGLAGAFGGMGGQSAFGTKAGDLFTRITIGVAAVWIFLCALSVKLLSVEDQGVAAGLGRTATQQSETVPTPVRKPTTGSAVRPPAKGSTPAPGPAAPTKQAPPSATVPPAALPSNPAPPTTGTPKKWP